MRGENTGPADHQWGRFGFLIADFFTLLAMLFLVANTVGHVTFPPPTPTKPPVTVTINPTPKPTATPMICGLSPTPLPDVTITIANDSLLRAGNLATERQVAAQIKARLAPYASKKVGLAIVWGGSFNGGLDVSDGTALANGAIASLKLLASANFMFTTGRTAYKPLWNGNLQSNQVTLTLYVYNVTLTSSCNNT